MSCLTGLVARCRFVPSARYGPAGGLLCSVITPHSRLGGRAGMGGSRGTGRPGGPRRGVGYRIQKLREGHQWVPAGRRRALPVGGGPRDPDGFREDFRALLELLRADKIHPVVAERLPLTEARRAHELLERSAAKGKLVLVP